MRRDGNILNLEIESWQGKFSEGVFDYSLPKDSGELMNNVIKVDRKSHMLMKNTKTNEVCLRSQIKQSHNDYEELAEIIYRSGEYVIKSIKAQIKTKKEDALCVRVDHTYNTRYPLNEGSRIRLGKASLQILSLKLFPFESRTTLYHSEYAMSPDSSILIERILDLPDEQPENENICRYCFMEEDDEQNKLLRLCCCGGSSKYVHKRCMVEWIMRRSNYQETSNGVYVMERKGIECEICKQHLRIEEFLPCFDKISRKSYMIVGTNAGDKQLIYIVDLKQKREIKIGRSNECHITLDDLSVSRHHCTLINHVFQGEVYIADRNSKFGTLIEKYSTILTHNMHLQKGRTAINVQMIQPPTPLELLKSFFPR